MPAPTMRTDGAARPAAGTASSKHRTGHSVIATSVITTRHTVNGGRHSSPSHEKAARTARATVAPTQHYYSSSTITTASSSSFPAPAGASSGSSGRAAANDGAKLIGQSATFTLIDTERDRERERERERERDNNAHSPAPRSLTCWAGGRDAVTKPITCAPHMTALPHEILGYSTAQHAHKHTTLPHLTWRYCSANTARA